MRVLRVLCFYAALSVSTISSLNHDSQTPSFMHSMSLSDEDVKNDITKSACAFMNSFISWFILCIAWSSHDHATQLIFFVYCFVCASCEQIFHCLLGMNLLVSSYHSIVSPSNYIVKIREWTSAANTLHKETSGNYLPDDFRVDSLVISWVWTH